MESYLQLKPDDEEMLQNKEYYKQQRGVEDGWFEPRSEVRKYIQRENYERKLIENISNEFKFPDNVEVPVEEEVRGAFSEFVLQFVFLVCNFELFSRIWRA